MKKITIITGIFALFMYAQPVLAWDNWGQADDPFGDVYDWGATCEACWDDLVIYGEGPSDDWTLNWPDWPSYWPSDWDDNGSAGGGGLPPAPNNGNVGNGNGNNNQGDKVKAVRNSLPEYARNLLEQKLREMLALYCTYLEMYDFLNNERAQFSDIGLDGSISSPGGYNACTDKLLFKNSNAINESFPEEFIHFFQDHYYVGGICVYQNDHSPQKNNLEFEAKFVQDLVNYIAMVQGKRDGGSMNYGAGLVLGDKYADWIKHLTQNGTMMPSSEKIAQLYQLHNYRDFMQDWANKNGFTIAPYFSANIFRIFDGCW